MSLLPFCTLRAVKATEESCSAPKGHGGNSDTPDFTAIAPRLAAAGYAVEEYEGHLWLPLQLAPDVGSATHQIDNLVAQVVRLHKTAIDWSDPT